MKFVKLFEPMKIRNVTFKNRIVMPAMHLNFTTDGAINDKELNFYEERAKGGVGFIIIGGCAVEKRGGAPSMIMIDDDKYIPGLEDIADRVHRHGAKIGAQLYHAGAYAMSFVSGEPSVSASAVYSKFSKETPLELTTDEIKQVQGKIADAAERAMKANFDAVELLGSAGYLINQFLSPITNKRTDEYGGSFENRLRFPLEVIEIVKNRVGAKILVGIRVSGDDFVPGSNTYVENAKIAKRYVEAGIDFINVTGGWHETRVPQIPSQVPPGAYAYLAENIRNIINENKNNNNNTQAVPVFSGNRINDPVIAEQILRDEKADAVSMGRALIADPYLPQKIQENKLWDIVKCVGCNQGCFDHIFKLEPVECMRNFQVSREGKYDLETKVEFPKKVLIIGAGPAGLEAARVAAILGHDVTIVDKHEEIGGQVNVAFVPHGRETFKDIIEYYQNQIEHLNIKLILSLEVTPEFITGFKADAVIFATGIKYSIPEIEGIDGSNGSKIIMADDALSGDEPVGKNVVIVGGSATGVETAIWAARQGALTPNTAHFLSFYKALPNEEIYKRWFRGPRNVTILELLPRIGKNIGKSSRWVMLDEIKSLGIKTKTNVNIQKFDHGSVIYIQDDETKQIDNVDTFILATGVKANKELYRKIKSSKPKFKIYNIGDSKKPRTILEGIHEGFKAAYKIVK